MSSVLEGGETNPVTGCLGDIFTNLLWRQTEGTDLWSEGGGSTNLTSGGTEMDDLLLVRVELGS